MNVVDQLASLPLDEADAFRHVIAHLREWPESRVSPDFSERVLRALPDQRAKPPRFSRFLRPLSLAAACVVLLTGGFFLFRARFSAVPQDDLAWLASVQEADGTWDPVRHGGNAAYRPALTALAALALDRGGGVSDRALERASEALMNMQRKNGAFGGSGREEQYNHAFTTYALAALSRQTTGVKTALKRAVSFLVETQSPAGGWDYLHGSDGNAAVTAWNVRALRAAESVGIRDGHVALCKGLRWLRGSVRDGGTVAYHEDGWVAGSESLEALAAFVLLDAAEQFPELRPVGKRVAARLSPSATAGMDCYRDYAKVLAFQAAGDEQAVRTVQAKLVDAASQPLSEDAWGRVGGQLYTSSLSILAQK